MTTHPADGVLLDKIRARTALDANGCWIWKKRIDRSGYGRTSLGSKRARSAHRAAYIAYHGSIAPGLQIDHLCKQTKCCNPAHLEAVTPEVNRARSNWQTIRNATATKCIRGHEFSEANTIITRDGRRNCLACKKFLAKLWYLKNKDRLKAHKAGRQLQRAA